MDFSFTPEQEALRETVRRFAETELAPLARAAEETERFPRQLFRRFGELGLIGVRYPAEDGGAGIMRDYPVGRIHRDALVYVIGEGTSEVQRNLIARGLDL
jgi:alkylation response protein AidB-like acyl-CoA dehydrogenase